MVNIVLVERGNNEKQLRNNIRYSDATSNSLSFWSYL